jgi:hypothetical protein
MFSGVRNHRQRLLGDFVHQELSRVLQHHLDRTVDHLHHLRAAENFRRVSDARRRSLSQTNKTLKIISQVLESSLIESDYVVVFRLLSYFARDRDSAKEIVNLKLPKLALKELASCDEQVSAACSRFVSNSLSHSEDIDAAFLEAGLIEQIVSLYEKRKLFEHKKLRENTTLMILNLLSSSSEVFERVIQSPIMQFCVRLLGEEQTRPLMQSQAVIHNIIDIFRHFYIKAENELLFQFSKKNPDIICLILKCTSVTEDSKIVIMCLIIVNKILGLGDQFQTEEFLDIILEKDVGGYLERLQMHSDKYVYNFTSKIIEKYFTD